MSSYWSKSACQRLRFEAIGILVIAEVEAAKPQLFNDITMTVVH